MSDPQHLTSGTVINDRYRIDSQIGSGGYSQVLAARDTSENRPVALKILHGEATDNDPRAVERMRQEAEILRAVSHPNIVRIFEVGTFDDGQFLVMEHVDGLGLDELIDRHGSLESDRLVGLVRQLLDALGAAHETEILHRDLKPDNILVIDDPDGEILKLVDFGVAKAGALLNADDFEEGVTLVKTRSGTFVGTPRYAAPEMVVGDPLSPASDLFCVGLIVYEALVGEPLIDGNSRSDLINQLVFPEPFDLQAVDAPWDQWLEKILDKSPEHRLSSCKEALERLDDLFGSPSSSPPSTDDGPDEPPLSEQPTVERASLHPKFGDSPPPTETEIDGPPDFEALDAAADPPSPDEPPLSEQPTADRSRTDRADTTGAPDETSDPDGPAESAGPPASEPTDDDTDPESSGSARRSLLLFLVVAVVTFLVAGLIFAAIGLTG